MAGKVRVSLTLNADVVGRIDRLVDGLYVRSRSEAVEEILSKFLEKEKTAVILCGGPDFLFKDTEIPRPLIKIKGKTIIERQVETLRKYGFSNIFVIGGQDIIKQVFDILKNGEGFGIKIAYFKESKPQGSAKVLEHLKKYIHSTFLVIPGDLVFDFDLGDMLDFHKEHKSMATIAVFTAFKTEHVSKELGAVFLKGSKVTKYVMPKTSEKLPETFIQSTLMLLFEPEILNYIPTGPVFWDLEKDLFPILLKESKLFAYPIHGLWFNVHNSKDVEDVKDVLDTE